jgi:hypothetical protein
MLLMFLVNINISASSAQLVALGLPIQETWVRFLLEHLTTIFALLA